MILDGDKIYTTIPDVALNAGHGVTEIKNVIQLAHTTQLRALEGLAAIGIKGKSASFNLIISPRTERMHEDIVKFILGTIDKPVNRGAIKIFDPELKQITRELRLENFIAIPKMRGSGNKVYLEIAR